MNEAEIRRALTTMTFERTIHYYRTLDSTNIRAKTLIDGGAREGTLVIADEQTSGHGRFGRKWVSESGKNLTFSLILQPKLPADKLGVVSLYASLAIAKAIENFVPAKPECKWPNDVLIDGKKVCGILSKAITVGSILKGVVVGIGINVNQQKFPEEIGATATSLSIIAGKTFDRYEILATILKTMESIYYEMQNGILGNILKEWMRYSTIVGKEIRIDRHGSVISGTATGLADDGGLIVRSNGKELKMLAGEVTIIQKENRP